LSSLRFARRSAHHGAFGNIRAFQIARRREAAKRAGKAEAGKGVACLVKEAMVSAKVNGASAVFCGRDASGSVSAGDEGGFSL